MPGILSTSSKGFLSGLMAGKKDRSVLDDLVLKSQPEPKPVRTKRKLEASLDTQPNVQNAVFKDNGDVRAIKVRAPLDASDRASSSSGSIPVKTAKPSPSPTVNKPNQYLVDEILGNIATSHFSSNSLTSAIARIYKVYVQTAADGQTYEENYNAAHAEFKAQLGNFITAAKKHYEENGVPQTNVKKILRNKISEARNLVLAEMDDCVSQSLEKSRYKYYEDGNIYKLENQSVARYLLKPVRPFGEPEKIDFNAFTKEGSNKLAGKAADLVFSKNKGADTVFGLYWNTSIWRPIWDATTTNKSITEEAHKITEEAIDYADADVNRDINEAIRDTSFAKESEPAVIMPTIPEAPVNRSWDDYDSSSYSSGSS